MVTNVAKVLGQTLNEGELPEFQLQESELLKHLPQLRPLAIPISGAASGTDLFMWFQCRDFQFFVIRLKCVGEPSLIWKSLNSRWVAHEN